MGTSINENHSNGARKNNYDEQTAARAVELPTRLLQLLGATFLLGVAAEAVARFGTSVGRGDTIRIKSSANVYGINDMDDDEYNNDDDFAAFMLIDQDPLSYDETFGGDVTKVDFHNRAEPIPPELWPALDNLTCVEEGLPAYPLNRSSGATRMPYVIIIGAMKGGTSALSAYIRGHPLVSRMTRKELHLFDFRFDRYATENGIFRRQGREHCKRVFRHVALDYNDIVQPGSRVIAVDDSPRYLLWSDRIPARVLCITPWAKIMAILRNPVDRAYSHFTMKSNLHESNHAKKEGTVSITFESWVKADIKDLKESGIIQKKIPRDEFAGSKEEMEAWKRYVRLGTHAPIGRGLYAIQLRHWFGAYKSFGIKPQENFMIVHSELFRNETSLLYKEILEFLNLDPYPLPKIEKDIMKGHYHGPMKAETRKLLENFYTPYNQELYKLLGWDEVW